MVLYLIGYFSLAEIKHQEQRQFTERKMNSDCYSRVMRVSHSVGRGHMAEATGTRT